MHSKYAEKICKWICLTNLNPARPRILCYTFVNFRYTYSTYSKLQCWKDVKCAVYHMKTHKKLFWSFLNSISLEIRRQVVMSTDRSTKLQHFSVISPVLHASAVCTWHFAVSLTVSLHSVSCLKYLNTLQTKCMACLCKLLCLLFWPFIFKITL